MATDWAADVKKYAPNADDGAIAGIVRYCGIALYKLDSSLVAFSDKKETDRVRENFLKKKLALTQADSVLDAAIAKVGETMKADRTKNRVTVYYLLADSFGKLGLFAAKAKAAAKAPAKKGTVKAAGAAALAGAAGAAAAKVPAKKKAAPAKKAPAKLAVGRPKAAAAAPQGLMDKAAGAGTAAVAAASTAAGAAVSAVTGTAGAAKDTATRAIDVAGDAAGAVAGAASAAVSGAAGLAAGAGSAVSGAVSQLAATGDEEDSGLGWLWWVIGLALLLFAAWYFFLRGPADDVAAPGAAATEAAASAAAAPDLAAAPAEGTVEIPAGAGVTSELRDGKPVVKVYFDTGKTDLAPAFAGAAGGLKAWLEANAGSSLAISGYSDPSGNAAANAELAKNRAQAVQAALVGAGIAETSALLVKPEETADATVPPEAARRVEVVVK